MAAEAMKLTPAGLGILSCSRQSPGRKRCPGGIASDTALIPAIQAWNVAGGMQLGVDFSRASGADALVVFTGSCPKGGKQVVAGSVTYQLVQMGGKAEEPKVSGDNVTLGGQTFHSDGKKILFAKIAKPQTLPRLGVWP